MSLTVLMIRLDINHIKVKDKNLIEKFFLKTCFLFLFLKNIGIYSWYTEMGFIKKISVQCVLYLGRVHLPHTPLLPLPLMLDPFLPLKSS